MPRLLILFPNWRAVWYAIAVGTAPVYFTRASSLIGRGKWPYDAQPQIRTSVRKLLLNNDKTGRREDKQIAATIIFCHLFCLCLTVFGPQIAYSIVIIAIFLICNVSLTAENVSIWHARLHFVDFLGSKNRTYAPGVPWCRKWRALSVNRWDYYEIPT